MTGGLKSRLTLRRVIVLTGTGGGITTAVVEETCQWSNSAHSTISAGHGFIVMALASRPRAPAGPHVHDSVGSGCRDSLGNLCRSTTCDPIFPSATTFLVFVYKHKVDNITASLAVSIGIILILDTDTDAYRLEFTTGLLRQEKRMSSIA
jgi:hypothetical protein